MRDYPILFFPEQIPAQRNTLNGGPSRKPHCPEARANFERLSPKFNALQSVLDSRAAKIQKGITTQSSDEVLVLETVTRIDYFVNAVKRIEGLEWLAETDIEITPDDSFYFDDNREQPLKGRLYLISTNNSALREVSSLFKGYVENPEAPLPRNYGKFKEIFHLLKDVRFWNNTDRLNAHDIENWLRDIEAFPDQLLRFQIELWFRERAEERIKAETNVFDALIKQGGKVLSTCQIPEIQYHAVLAETSAQSMRQILSNMEEGALIQCNGVMFIRPSGQMVAPTTDVKNIESIPLQENEPLPKGKPILGLFDGYPFENHSVLKGRLIIDDPDSYEENYLVNHRIHGTQMASVIVKGDLSLNEQSINKPLYVRPIMKYDSKANVELVPEDCLLVDLVHRAVKRMFEGENNIPPVAPTVKIINLSIADPVRVFDYSVSPLARLLDWLSYKYKILFIISAGNWVTEFYLDCSDTEFLNKPEQERAKYCISQLLKYRSKNKIMSPGESINNITVGAAHYDNSDLKRNDKRLNPYNGLFPSIYTPFGGGVRRSIKPDLIYNGGRMLYTLPPIRQIKAKPSFAISEPGINVASPGNGIDGRLYDRGTSHATALVSRNALFYYEQIVELLKLNNISQDYAHIFVKAMLIHGCSWNNIDGLFHSIINDICSNNAKDVKKIKAQWIGYGYPDFTTAVSCTSQKVIVMGCGSLYGDQAHQYSFPIPPSISSKRVKRRLVITLAWQTPVSSTSQRYRVAHLWFKAPNKLATKKDDIADERIAGRGTIQHEVFEGENAVAFQDGDNITINVNCTKDAAIIRNPVNYVLIVSLDVSEGIDIPIYEEVRDRLRIPIKIGNNTDL